MLVDAAAGMLQMCPAPGTGTPGFGMGGHRRAAGGAAHSAGQPGVPLHPKCPSRVAPVKETRELGSALKKQPKLLFHLRPASARAARSLEPVLRRGGSAGDGAPQHLPTPNTGCFCTKPSAEELPQPRDRGKRPPGSPGTCGVAGGKWVHAGAGGAAGAPLAAHVAQSQA